ncbi:Flavonoid 3'-monooxygenase [Vitis vinifera]|uniref:Flavonoid 3'-monooxygenase n=1 Tax=Vitis vinifera TaxID=29760 RepID=A0A438ESB7_VITVI|nr:Flavonoid 3'-monooxygenase [Vitis vinifera]
MLSSATLDVFYDLRRQEFQRTHVVGWDGEGGRESEPWAEFRRVVAAMTELMGKPNISDFFPGLARFDLQGIRKRFGECALKFEGIFDSIIQQRMKIDKEGGNGGGKDFLQFLLRLKDEGHAKTPLTMNHVRALLLDMVVGGTDTTSNTVEFAMAEMMNKPEVMRKAQQELEVVVGRDKKVEESHIGKLPYLYAVMKEVLRLHPALPLLVPHCPSESCVVGGYTIPKGARVFVNVWAIHRDPSIWKSPLEFDPERFLRGTWDYSGKDFSYFPFGSGRRICAEKLDLSEKFGIVLTKKMPLVAIPTPRLSHPLLYEYE